MLKFTSVSDSVRAITDIILTVTIIHTGITITGRTTGTADIVTIATIIIVIITGTSLTGIATPGWLEAISSQPNFGPGIRRGDPPERDEAVYFPYFGFGEAAGLVTGLLPGSSIWNSLLNC
jgi:hypothetical protein